MDTTRKVENIQKETLELVLEEFAEEQKSSTKSLNDLVTAVNRLSGKLSSFEEKLNTPKQVNVSVDTKPIQEIVRKGIADIVLAVASQPKNLVRKFQVLLFPEQDAKLFYKVVFGRWFLMLAIMLFITCFYKFSIHWSNNQKEIKLRQLENDRIKKAWNYLYYTHDKKTKRLMDSAYIKGSLNIK
ncbi:hypothetical protein [Chitinophaga japonensis]|uniref:Uncharacterized protein n=1 Tax=Chitinophaga japonensis TaxID=104662 RepID=A0A562TCC5_CHIJA|nr:hypothetical protein [Chitinophaga japonensis]TWI91145.1 hypothetical protein LX66_0507 [Chitinophaga japonensis]